MKEYVLESEERKVKVIFDGKKIEVNGDRSTPKMASLDMRRIIPLWITVVIVISIVFFSMLIGSILGRIDAAIIATAAGMGIGAVVYLALSRVEQVLLVETRSDHFEFKGSVDDLRSLYYEISKVTIKKMKEKEKEMTTPMKGAGVTKGDSYLDSKDLDEVKGDMKKSVLIGKKMVTQICPECGNDELYYEGGFMTGHVYHCKRCDYVGSFVLEKELDLSSGKT